MPENPPEFPDETNSDANLVSFVVHLWQEEPVSEKHQAAWRGHITYVPNGKRLYFKNVSEIPELIVGYLKSEKRA